MPAEKTGTSKLRGVDLPLMWPMFLAAELAEEWLALYANSLKFVEEQLKINSELQPELATANAVMLDLRTMLFRDYSRPEAKGAPVIVYAPYAGHSAMLADYYQGQSLMETLLANGLSRVYLTDWKPATEDMKDLEIDQYLAELNVCVDDLGGCANLIGLCQGGWMCAMYAARFPHKATSLVLAGSPIDTDAGDNPVKRMSHIYPASFYEQLISLGHGLMRGRIMQEGWKATELPSAMQYRDLYVAIDDPAYGSKVERFRRWFEHPIDLPGRWYMQAVVELFKENRLAKGTFVGLGRRLNLKDITCPVYLLAAESDEVAACEQVFDTDKYIGTPKDRIEKKLVPGGHLGLFVGPATLRETWPRIARWMLHNQ